MAIAGESEVLEHGGGASVGSSARTRLLVGLVLVVAAAAGLVDWQARRHQSADVARCVAVTTSAVTQAVGRVTLMAEYVRPTLSVAPPGELRSELLSMVSDSAAPGSARLHRARDSCSATDVWRVHGDLRRTRTDCLQLLDGQLGYLADVSADGVLAFGADGVPRGRCRAA